MNISVNFASFVICALTWYYPYVIIFILGENYGFSLNYKKEFYVVNKEFVVTGMEK